MSACRSAMIIFGLPRQEIDNEDECFEYNMTMAMPYYDGGEDGIIGFPVHETGEDDSLEINLQDVDASKYAVKFWRITGKEGRLYLTPNVS